MSQQIFVTCPGGLEALLMDELTQLGFSSLRAGVRGVFVPQSMEAVYKINYCSRLATRVLWPLAQFRCKDQQSLYAAAKKIRWSDYLTPRKSFAIDANVQHRNLKNSLFASLVVKDALCDVMRDQFGERPSVNVGNPDVQLNLFIHDEHAVISLDTSGMPLYKRGYRLQTGVAPIQESLAAALLSLAKYTPEEVLCDPFCGSGTLLIEAAMQSTKTAAGFFRKSWGFVHLPIFSEQAWLRVKQEADAKRVPLPRSKIFGNDKDPSIIRLCRGLLKTTDYPVDLESQDISLYRPRVPPTLVVCNPPYGKRLEADKEMYRDLGKFLKTQCAPNVRAHVLTSDSQLIAATGLPIKNRFPLFSGGLKVSLYELDLLQTR